MHFELLTTAAPALDPQLQWLWYSDHSRSFIVGDERSAFSLPIDGSHAPAPLPLEPNGLHRPPLNLPLSATMLEEFVQGGWHAFRYLTPADYDRAVDAAGHPVGDLLRTLVFGPDYGLYVAHPTGPILSLRAGSMELIERSGDGFTSRDKTKTRGRAALAFAAHPSEPLIAYGDNFGAFHAHRFDPAKFGKASKIADRERKASRLAFLQNGDVLLIGGMGYLATYSHAGGKFTPLHEASVPVRDFVAMDDGRILVNHGLHGISLYEHSATGLTKTADLKPSGAVQQVAVSSCKGFLGLTLQGAPSVSLYGISAS